MSTLDHHSTGTAGSTRAMLDTAPPQHQVDQGPSDLCAPNHPPATTERNLYAARPQSNDIPQGQHVLPKLQLQPQGHQSCDVAGNQPHGYVNCGFLPPTSQSQPAKAHAQALSAQLLQSKPRPAFGQAHGQPKLQRQSGFEMNKVEEQLEPGQPVEAVTSGVLYRV